MTKKMKTLKEIVNNGIQNSPLCGNLCEFNKREFAYSHEEFVEKLKSLYEEGDYMYEAAYEGTGNTGPIGEVAIFSEKGYVYVYLMNNYGDYEARLFTHEVIAGKFPSYKEYKKELFEEYYNSLKRA